ncbi:MAG: tol-pal system protein YbgF, partial [Pseudomonadota bacterium]
QQDFDRAKEVLGQGDFPGAATLFATYAQSYPGGPLVPEAHFLRGEALTKQGDTAGAARAYLDAFSAKPDGPMAADALLKLGEGLGALGQVPEACVTLAEVGTRFPGSMAATQATVAMQGFGCQ